MSGWIKFDKDMSDDPRLLEAAAHLSKRYSLARRSPEGDLSASESLAFACNAVTGALVTLWKYADIHIRDDDTLPMTRYTLDAMIGIDGFFDIMPRDWIDELEDGTIILPGYCTKNSLIAKKKATEKSNARVRAFRARKKAERNQEGNGVTQAKTTVTKVVDQDQDLLTYTAKFSETEIREHMTAIRADYPPPARADWITGEKRARQLVLEGDATWEQLREGTKRYRAHCEATSRIPLNPARFFGDIDRPWSMPWDIPVAKPKQGGPRAAPVMPSHEAMWASAKSRARAIGFREPYLSESAAVYMTEVELAERPPQRAIDAIGTATIQKMRMGAS